MHRRCCWPPDSPAPGSSRRSATSFHRPASRSAASTLPRRSPRPRELRRSPGGDVVEDRHRRERVGLLEDHADGSAHGDDVHRGVVDVESLLEHHPSLRAGSGDLLVHAVDAADHRRLAAPGRPDDRGHLVGAELDVDALDLVRRRRRRRAAARALTLSPALASTAASLLACTRVDGGGGARESPRGRLEVGLGYLLLLPVELRSAIGIHSATFAVGSVDVMLRRTSFAR